MNELEVAPGLTVSTVGPLIATTVTMPDGRRVRLLADEKTIARQVLAYRAMLLRARGKEAACPEKPTP